MKSQFAGLAVAALLVTGLTLPGHAEDAVPKTPAAPQSEAPPPSVARPALVPKAATPAAPATTTTTADPDAKTVTEDRPRPRRSAHRHYGRYRTAYWEPFPVYWPHLYRNRIHWNRIPWTFRF